jgi:hypothetical protein
MTYAQALRSIDPNRRIAEVDASEHRRDLGHRPSPRRLKVPPAAEKILRRITLMDVLTAGGTAVVALAILMLVGRSGDTPTPATTAAPPPPPTRSSPPAEAVVRTTTPAERPEATSEEAPPDPPPDPPPASRGTITFAAPADPVPEAPAEAGLESPLPIDDGEENEPEVVAAVPDLSELTPEDLEAMGATETERAVWEAEVAAQAERAASEAANVEAAAETLAGPTEDPAAPTTGVQDAQDVETTVAAPLEVRRALLAGDVVDGEPIGILPEVVTLPPQGERLVYFYVELGDAAGEPVTHRWLNAGGIEEEQALEAPGGGNVRAYTARRISADRAGEWRVEALGADGRLLAVLDFRVEVDDEAATATLAEETTAE